jgi:hypothetical protein
MTEMRSKDMANPEQPVTATGRSASEIGFALRRAKWRSGPEVLRDIARADAEPPEAVRDRAAAAQTAPPGRRAR